MDHIGVDLGGRESQICVRDCTGAIVTESRERTARLELKFAAMTPGRVILETSAEAFAVADAAMKAGHEVRVVPATLVRTLGVGARSIKTDKRDARVLSEVSSRIDLPSVHIPSESSRDLKALCRSRECLVSTRTKLINRVRGWMRTQLWKIRTGGTETFPTRIRDRAADRDASVPPHIERILATIELLTKQIVDCDKELAVIAQSNEVCRRLMTVPGVGPVTAIRFMAAVDRPSRFASAHQLQSYFGLTPGESSSSDKRHRTGITKAGAKDVRWCLVQAAWTAIRVRPDDAMVQWANKIAERRGRSIAAVALARKLAGIMLAIWRNGTRYNPRLGAEVSLRD